MPGKGGTACVPKWGIHQQVRRLKRGAWGLHQQVGRLDTVWYAAEIVVVFTFSKVVYGIRVFGVWVHDTPAIPLKQTAESLVVFTFSKVVYGIRVRYTCTVYVYGIRLRYTSTVYVYLVLGSTTHLRKLLLRYH